LTTIGSTATSGAVRVGLSSQRRDWAGAVFQALLLLSLLFSLAILFALIGDVLTRALPVFSGRGLGFFTSTLASDPSRAGIVQGVIGTAILGVLVALIAFPIGIMTAIYLEEYAPDSRLTGFIAVNIRNLAGVPSVVYGLLGLSVFVGLINSLDGDAGNGRTIIAGGVTLAVLVLPIVIITSIEALRAVPNAIREAGYGVGASRWEVTRKLVLPSAAPGILTGTVLALSRALGETAPLVIAGAVLGTFTKVTLDSMLTGSYTALPMIVYDWARKPQEEFRALTSAAIVALLGLTLIVNALAVLLRNRYDRRW